MCVCEFESNSCVRRLTDEVFITIACKCVCGCESFVRRVPDDDETFLNIYIYISSLLNCIYTLI